MKQMVADESPPSPGLGYAQTYKDGVLDSSEMPFLSFSGQWQPIPYSESGLFISDKINSNERDKNDRNVGVFVEETQVNIGYKYENKVRKTIQYTLTIQRSTGRFAESFQLEADKFPFLENTGYCAYS